MPITAASLYAAITTVTGGVNTVGQTRRRRRLRSTRASTSVTSETTIIVPAPSTNSIRTSSGGSMCTDQNAPRVSRSVRLGTAGPAERTPSGCSEAIVTNW